MADRVSISRKIVCSDVFIALPMSARCLYFALCMEADYNGVVNNPRAVMRMSYSQDCDIEALGHTGFIACEDGIVRIVHWKYHFGIEDEACYTYHREREDR